MSQTKKLQLIQLVWALQEFSARNCESIPLRGISCASGERLAALAFRLRRTLAPSALVLAFRARFFSRLRRSYLGQLPRIETLTKTTLKHAFLSILGHVKGSRIWVTLLRFLFGVQHYYEVSNSGPLYFKRPKLTTTLTLPYRKSWYYLTYIDVNLLKSTHCRLQCKNII